MFQSIDTQSPVTPAESTRHSWEEESRRLERAHDITIRQLELAYLKQQQRWDNLFRIPMIILKLPLYLLMGFGFIISMARKHDPTVDFWNLLK